MRLPITIRPLLLAVVGGVSVCFLPIARAAADQPDEVARGLEESSFKEMTDFMRLWRAVYDNDPAAVNAVVGAGVDVNAKSPSGLYLQSGRTALHFAAEFQALAAADVLLARGADANVKDDAGRSPLHYVVVDWLNNQLSEDRRERSIRFAERLLRHKADINGADALGMTPLHYAAMAEARAAINFLRDNGARYDIFAAIGLGDADHVAALLAESPELARGTLKAGTPLHFAARQGQLRLAELLIEAGADVDARNAGGNTPLHWACGDTRGQSELVALLLTKTRAIDARNDRNRTPLHTASEHYWASRTNIPGQLLAKGAHVNARDDQGLTPLHFAAYTAGNKELCELLLAHGADLHAKSDAGNTAASLARMHPEYRELNAYFGELLKKEREDED